MRRIITQLASVVCLLALPHIGAGQTVQLPQFQFTTAATTVLVPDRGEVLMGGISRAADGRSQFGVPILGKIPVAGRPFNNVGIGQSRSKGTLSVKAYIHDFEAMDEAVLAEAAARRGGAPVGAVSLKPQASSLKPVLSVSAIERRREAAREAEEDEKRFEVSNFLAKAQEAEAAGQPGVARIFYGMVVRHCKDADTRAMAQQRVAELAQPNKSAKLASNPR